MNSGRKTTGGRYKRPKKRKLTGRQNQARVVKLGENKTRVLRTRGGGQKTVMFQANKVNLVIKGKSKVVKITNVKETPSDTFLARQNILVKGAIIETELGRARITNRPSQEGNVQAVLIEKA